MMSHSRFTHTLQVSIGFLFQSLVSTVVDFGCLYTSMCFMNRCNDVIKTTPSDMPFTACPDFVSVRFLLALRFRFMSFYCWNLTEGYFHRTVPAFTPVKIAHFGLLAPISTMFALVLHIRRQTRLP